MSSRFEHFFTSLVEIKLACNRCLTSISTEHDCSSFFSKKSLKCTSEVNKVHKNNFVKKRPFFHLSVCEIDLFNFSKNSKDTGPA